MREMLTSWSDNYVNTARVIVACRRNLDAQELDPDRAELVAEAIGLKDAETLARCFAECVAQEFGWSIE